MKNALTRVLSLFILTGILGASAAGDATNKPVRLAILEFEMGVGTNRNQGLAALCEQSLLEQLRTNSKVELVERSRIDQILKEHALSQSSAAEDPLHSGELLGADWLLFGRVRSNPLAVRVEALMLEVASGNVLLTAGIDVEESAEKTARGLAALVQTRLPLAFNAREQDRTKPAFAVLTVRNISRIRRLDYLQSVIHSLLEESVSAAGKYRLLRRQHAGVAGLETELGFAGWCRPSDAVIARHADVAISVEFEEQYQAGLSFDDTPLEIRVKLERRGDKSEDIAVHGRIAAKDALLKSLAENVKVALGSETQSAPGESGGENRIIEASRLMEEAIGKNLTDDIFKTDASLISESENYEIRIKLLEKAVYLDPGLLEARYWLATCLAQKISTLTNSADRLAMLEREIRELEIFLQGAPRVDTRPYDLSRTSVNMSRSPGALREKAYHDLIWGYSHLASLMMGLAENKRGLPMSSEEREAWRLRANAGYRKLTDAAVAYLTEPPKKSQPDWVYFLPVYPLRLQSTNDPQPMIAWFLFINSIYGKEHEGSNVRCPFLCLSEELLRLKQPQKALDFYERGMKEHNHDRTATSGSRPAYSILASIYGALGREKEAKDLERQVESERREAGNDEPFRERFSAWPGANAVAVSAPEELLKPVKGLPEGTDVFACGIHRSGAYFFVAGQGGIYGAVESEARTRNVYRFQQLLWQPADGSALEELRIERDGQPARVTVILPVGDVIWFGTHQGLACFDPRTRRWRWLGPKEGLPTNLILCGVEVDGTLWFGGGGGYGNGLIFSFDPQTGQVRTYLPDIDLSWPTVTSLVVMDQFAVACTAFRPYRIDLRNGKWRGLALLPPAGKWAVQPEENLGNSYGGGARPGLCASRCWIAAAGGLAVLDTNREPFACQVQFSSGFSEQRSAGVFHRTCIPPDCPLSGRVAAVAGDGKLLWLACNDLSAYDPGKDTWYGPLALPCGIADLLIAGDDIWALGSSAIRINRADFLRTARAAGLCRTTAEYRRAQRRDESDVLKALRFAAELKFSDAVPYFAKAATAAPDDPLPQFWKAYCLERTTPPRYAEAVALYEQIAALASNSVKAASCAPEAAANAAGDPNQNQDPAPKLTPRLLRRLAESEKLRCLYDSGRTHEAFHFGTPDTDQHFRFRSYMLQWAAVLSGELRQYPGSIAPWLARDLGADFGPEVGMDRSAWAAVRGKEAEGLWQNGEIAAAVNRVEAGLDYLDADQRLYLDAGKAEKAEELLRKRILEYGFDNDRLLLALSLLYREEPALEQAEKYLMATLNGESLSAYALPPLQLLRLRLEALRALGDKNARRLLRAESDLYRGLYTSGDERLSALLGDGLEQAPLMQAEAARLRWEASRFVYEREDKESLGKARAAYKKTAEHRDASGAWSVYCLLKLAVATGEDIRPWAAKAREQFSKTVVAEEAWRFQCSVEDRRMPFLCAWMKSPADYGRQTVFQRRGILIGLLGDRASEITHASWVDGMGVWTEADGLSGRPWHRYCLACPGWSLRPGLCLVDYYHEDRFVTRRTFIVSGRVPNNQDAPLPAPSSTATP